MVALEAGHTLLGVAIGLAAVPEADRAVHNHHAAGPGNHHAIRDRYHRGNHRKT